MAERQRIERCYPCGQYWVQTSEAPLPTALQIKNGCR